MSQLNPGRGNETGPLAPVPPDPGAPVSAWTVPGPVAPIRADADDPQCMAARAAMVATLEEAGELRPGRVRDALLALPRQLLMPQAYVRRTAPDEKPARWDLLDWSSPQDRPELLGLLYGGGSVPVQHAGEPVLGRVPGSRSGGQITSSSTLMSLTAYLLQELDLQPGQRVLDVGTGAGVTAAVACHVCGDAGVVTLDRDHHVTDAAAVRLSSLDFRPQMVCGDGDLGCPQQGPYDRVFVSYAVPRVPAAWVDQLAPEGRLLVHVTAASPSWPGLAVVTRRPDGQIEGELRGVEFAHRAGHGMQRIFLSRAFLNRISTGRGEWTQLSRLSPPPDSARGLWLAVDHLAGGLVRDFNAEDLVIGAPGCGSWLIARADGAGHWSLAADGPRDIWAEIQDVAARWRAAGEPSIYRLHLEDNRQWVSAGPAAPELSWSLPNTDSSIAEGEP